MATTLNNFAVFLHAIGRDQDAMKHLSQALTLLEESLPPGHPRLLECRASHRALQERLSGRDSRRSR
jgi:hypothetical protein